MKRAYVRPTMVGERFVAIKKRCINLNVMLAVVKVERYI